MMAAQEHVPRYPEPFAPILAVPPDATVAGAAEILRENRIGCLVVTGDDGRLIGVVSERDIINRVVALGVDPSTKLVKNVMTTDVAHCQPDTSMDAAQAIMAERHIRHLPVVQDGVAVGMISSRDVMAGQLQAERERKTAAEQVARLSTTLKSLDFREVVDMITREVPSIFQAGRSVLCFPEELAAGETVFRASRYKCLCPERELLLRRQEQPDICQHRAVSGDVPGVCQSLGAQSPSIVIPLDVSAPSTDDGEDGPSSYGFLCMCDIDSRSEVSPETITYKGRLLADVLSMNLINAKLYEEYLQARRSSLTDTLTGVGTRRLFEDALAGESARAQRYHQTFSLAIIDIDHFKEINDRLGHAVGDKALTSIGACMTRQKRKPDIVARYGGDEFILLMPETTVEQAVVLLERIRAQVERTPMPQSHYLTISCGVVSNDGSPGVSTGELVRRADLALYEAKRTGRNRVFCWDSVRRELQYGTVVEDERIEAMENQIGELLKESRESFLQDLWGLAQALDAKDPYAGRHSENVTHYSVHIAQAMELTPEEIAVIRRAATIHDVGKIGVPDEVLNKKGRLTPEERRTMEEHPLVSVRILHKMSFLSKETPIVRHHHERWDGLGYPDGISGTAIEPGACILAVADAFDAITCTRTYHDAKTVTEAMTVLAEGAGSQFDPQVVEAMSRWVAQIKQGLDSPEHILVDDLLNYQPVSRERVE